LSFQGRASEIRQARRDRLLNDNQLWVAKWITPFIVLTSIYVIWSAFQVFGVDAEAVKSLQGTTMYYAGLVLQCWSIMMLIRCFSATLIAYKKSSSSDD